MDGLWGGQRVCWFPLQIYLPTPMVKIYYEFEQESQGCALVLAPGLAKYFSFNIFNVHL